ncbi:MAG: T9SS type A sorting domain-containing protein [Bacteroidales bacterium]|nr:T9SS type A sorting domain-containing protein [Bacteroidales bacterium]
MKTQHIFQLILFVALFPTTMLQAQSWQWVQSYGGPNSDYTTKICLDQAGNVYTTSTCMFPYTVFGTNTLAVGYVSEIFISKLDCQGKFLWIRRAGGFNPEGGEQDVWDMYYHKGDNSLIMTGVMSGDDRQIGGCPCYDYLGFFLSKLDTAGNCIWAKTYATLGEPSMLTIYPDSLGYIYMAGNTRYKAWFTSNMSIQPGGFLAKFRADDGSLIWVKKVLERNGVLSDLVIRPDGIIVSGTSDTDLLKIGGTQVPCRANDAFIARFTLDGNLEWVKTMGGPGIDIGGDLQTDNFGNLFLSGIFNGSATFGKVELNNNGKEDFYLTKLDVNGTVLWANQLHISGGINGIFHYTNNTGETWLNGAFLGSARFGEELVTATSGNELFVAKYSTDGLCIGVIHDGSMSNDAFACNSSGEMFIAGGFYGTTYLGENKLVSRGSRDGFFARHDALTGIPHPPGSPQLKLIIYANPTTGKCTITIPGEFMHEKQLTLTVFDSMGKLVKKRSVPLAEGKISLNLEALARGIYQVTLDNGEKSYVGRVVFE